MGMKHKRALVISRILIHISIGFSAILAFIPLWYVLNNAFKNKEYIIRNPLILLPEYFTFDNIIRAFKVMHYAESLINNLIILASTCSLLIFFGSAAGYSITVSGSKLLEKYYTLVVMVITIPFQIAMVPLVSMMNKMGLMNTYLGVSLVFSAFSLPFVIFLYTGYTRSLPKELAEAATIDGCGLFGAYIHIYMPLLKTVTGTVLILRGVFVWNDLLIPIVTISKSAMTPLSLRLYSFASVRLTSWDLVFGGTLLVSLPITIIFIFLQGMFIKGIVAGSVKG